MDSWFVYIVQCFDGTFYTGISNNVKKRIEDHNKGKGAKYTKTRTPVQLKMVVKCTDKSDASKREWEIKQYTREGKFQLIKHFGLKDYKP